MPHIFLPATRSATTPSAFSRFRLRLALGLIVGLGACTADDGFTGDDFDDQFGQDQKSDGFTELVHYAGILDEDGYTHFGSNYGREYGEHHIVTVTESDDHRLFLDMSPNVYPGILFHGSYGENVDLLLESSSDFDINVYRLVSVDRNNQFKWSKRLNADGTNVSYPLSDNSLFLAVLINRNQGADAQAYLTLKRHQVIPLDESGTGQTAVISMPMYTHEVWGSARREIASCGRALLDLGANINVPFRIRGLKCEEAAPEIEGAQTGDLFSGGMHTTLEVELLLPENTAVVAPTLRTSDDVMDMHDLSTPWNDVHAFRSHCKTTAQALADRYETSNPIASTCGHVQKVQVDVPERHQERVSHRSQVWLAPLD